MPVISEPFTLDFADGISLRIYPDTRPHCLETAQLQKGLVLMFHGKELIEEGVGFGLPVLKYRDKTYFAGHADTFITKSGGKHTIVKEYKMDTVSKKKLGKSAFMNDKFCSFAHRLFEKVYLKDTKLKPIFNKMMELRQAVGINTEFVTVRPRASITVHYACNPDTIRINVEVNSIISTRCKELLILNEQGSSHFRNYSDSSGLKLSGNRIGAWEEIRDYEPTFSTTCNDVAFSLQKVRHAKMLRGWEWTKGRFCWAGVSYSLHPNLSQFGYTIRLRQGK